MVRRKKLATVVASPPRTRRLTRASTSKIVQSTSNLESEPNISATSGKQECEHDSQDCTNLSTSPISIPRHKNFGKYRCLSTKNSNSSLNRNSDACTSDSEMLNNVEVKVVDPCASSESENSNSLEATNLANRLGTDSLTFRSFSRLSRSDRSSNSGSPVTLKSVPTVLPENITPKNTDNSSTDNNITLSTLAFDTQIPDPTLSIIPNDDPRRSYKSSVNNFSNFLGSMSPFLKIDNTNDDVEYVNNYSPANTGDDSQESLERMSNGDNEVYTIYEIIGEDPDYKDHSNSEETSNLYSNNESPSSPSKTSYFNMSPKNDDEIPSKTQDENINKTESEGVTEEFENKMSNISLSQDDSCANSELTAANYPDNSNSNDSRSTAIEKNNINDSVSNISQISSEEKKIDELMNATESCSTPNSMMSEEENHPPSKVECEILSTEKSEVYSTDSSSSSSTGVRRSSRIKTINVLKQRKGHGLVKNLLQPGKDIFKKNENNKLSSDSSQTMLVLTPQNSPVFSIPSSDSDSRPVKVKSRWRRSSEMEMGSRSPITPPLNSPNSISSSKLSSIAENVYSSNSDKSKSHENSTQSSVMDRDIQERLNQFQNILINDYHCEKTISKEAKRMTCDCFLTKEEVERGEMGCGEDCLNRLLMIECNSRCPIGDRCTNRRFQSNQYADLRVIKTEKKGLGIQASTDISGGEFLMEYVGEVLNWQQFNQRAQEYSTDKNTHHYFMSLKGDAVIDATLKGNISRFINHSCDPNAETQKWTVNGDLRIGFFSKRDIKADDEITFDYQFQRYGKEGLRCFCEASNCRGWIGEEPDDASEEEEEIEQEVDENEKNNVKVDVDDTKEHIPEKDLKVDSIKSNDVPIESPVKAVRKKYKRRQFTKRPFNEILQDKDLEEEMRNLNRSGIKNQSHTLSLCRAMVRAKHTEERVSLLKLLASADLPCRRLFLDYRGLRLLAPWCENTESNFRLEMLNALIKLPIPNKTVLKENKLLVAVERWCEEASPVFNFNKDDSSNDSMPGTPVLINEKTGLPIENYKAPIKLNNVTTSSHDTSDNDTSNKKSSSDTTSDVNKKINTLSKELIELWTTLPEVFKIPKKERIQLMKEHERQANEPQLKIDDSESGKERWEERYSRHDKDKDKKRSIQPIIDVPRRNQIRLDDRVLASIPTMSKEERRRDFAARVAHEEQLRRNQSAGQPLPVITTHPAVPPVSNLSNHWIPPDQNVTHLPYGGMNNTVPPADYSMSDYAQSDYMQMDYSANEYMQTQNSYPYCPPPQHVYPIPAINTSIPPPTIHPTPNYNPNYMPVPFPNHNYNPTTPLLQSPSFQNIPLPPGTTNLQRVPPPMNSTPQPIPSLGTQHVTPLVTQPIPTVVAMQTTPVIMIQPVPVPQPIPTLVPPSATQYPLDVSQNDMDLNYYQTVPPVIEPMDVTHHNRDNNISITIPIKEKQQVLETTSTNDVVRWSSVRLPSRWRSMKDARGRTYYYHVKYRIPQWIPPIYSPTLHSREENSSDEEQEDNVDETETENSETTEERTAVTEKLVEGVNGVYQVIKEDKIGKINGIVKAQVIIHVAKKPRLGLATERIISPRNEEDKIASKLELKRYKERKEKMRRRKEMGLAVAGCPDSLNKYIKRLKSSKHKKAKVNDVEAIEKAARRIKEIFRASMARVMVHHLDPYRREDCIIGRITNTPDFKHLARKLTHFVMLKELKHCQSVNDLKCNDSVKQKAKEFVKKYMAKFGPVYQRPPDEMEC